MNLNILGLILRSNFLTKSHIQNVKNLKTAFKRNTFKHYTSYK